MTFFIHQFPGYQGVDDFVKGIKKIDPRWRGIEIDPADYFTDKEKFGTVIRISPYWGLFWIKGERPDDKTVKETLLREKAISIA